MNFCSLEMFNASSGFSSLKTAQWMIFDAQPTAQKSLRSCLLNYSKNLLLLRTPEAIFTINTRASEREPPPFRATASKKRRFCGCLSCFRALSVNITSLYGAQTASFAFFQCIFYFIQAIN